MKKDTASRDASFPDLIPLLGQYKSKSEKRRYTEIRQQLAVVEHQCLLKEKDELRNEVKMLMEQEAAFTDNSARNRSFLKRENPYLKLEVRRLKAKVKQLQNQLHKFQKKVAISFPGK